MTVPFTPAQAVFNWTGVESTFPCGFQARQESEISVFHRSAAGVLSNLTLGANFTVSIHPTTFVVTVTRVSFPTAAGTITVRRNSPYLQTVDFVDGEAVAASTHEELHDSHVRRDQELRRDIDENTADIGVLETQWAGFAADVAATATARDTAQTARDQSVAASIVAQAQALLAQQYAAMAAGTPSVATRAIMKATAAAVGVVFLSDPTAFGHFIYDATIPVATHQRDALDANGVGEGIFVAPSPAQPGAWRRLHRGRLNPVWFGLEAGTGRSALVRQKNRDAIQRPIDLIETTTVGGDVVIPPGDFEYVGTVQQGYGVGFRTVNVYGSGKAFQATAGSRTLLWHYGPTTAQAWNMQGLRNSYLRGLSICSFQETNFYPLISPPTQNRIFDSAWNVITGRADGGDSRYAPYAGITVDAHSGPRNGGATWVATESYPDIVYPSFFGVVAQYNKNPSSKIVIEDVEVRGFTAAIAVQPANYSGNGDFPTLRDVLTFYNKFGLSVGQDQCRVVCAYNSQFSGSFVALTNDRHGRQTGHFGGEFSGCDFSFCTWLGDFALSHSASIKFTSCKGESVWAFFQTSGSGGSIIVEASDFNLNWQLHSGLCGSPQYEITGPSANVTFTGCQIRCQNGLRSQSGRVRYIGGTWVQIYDHITTGSMPPWRVPFHQTFCGGIVSGNSFTTQHDVLYRGASLNVARNAVTDMGEYRPCDGAAIIPGRAHFVPAWQPVSLTPRQSAGPGRIAQPRPFFTRVFSKAGLTLSYSPNASTTADMTNGVNTCVVASNAGLEIGQPLIINGAVVSQTITGISGTTITLSSNWTGGNLTGVTFVAVRRIMTITHTGGLTDQAAFFEGWLPGDMLRCADTGTVFVIRARNVAVLTCLQMNNFFVDGNQQVAVPSTGNFEVVNCRVYNFANGYAEFSATFGNNVLTFVNGVFPSEIVVDDGLLAGLDNAVLRHSNVESRVQTVTSPTSLTMQGAAQKTVNVTCAFAISLPPPNAP